MVLIVIMQRCTVQYLGISIYVCVCYVHCKFVILFAHVQVNFGYDFVIALHCLFTTTPGNAWTTEIFPMQ